MIEKMDLDYLLKTGNYNKLIEAIGYLRVEDVNLQDIEVRTRVLTEIIDQKFKLPATHYGPSTIESLGVFIDSLGGFREINQFPYMLKDPWRSLAYYALLYVKCLTLISL